MKKVALEAALVLSLLCFSALAPNAFAHGGHIWFVSPEQNSAVEGTVTFEVAAPYAKNRYIHISVTKEDKQEPVWEGLVTLGDRKYSLRVDTKDWDKGNYTAEVTLVGGIFQHPVRRDFVVK